MTLVFERESSGPGTHALIVASGEIPRYPAKGSMAPLNAARELADWLTGHFRNDTAPLASVDMLASSPGRSDFARAQELHVLDPPRSGTFDAALRAWRERLDSDPGNIAVFYYAGYVLRPGETLLAPHDLADYAGGGGGPISFASLTRFMRGCQADRQLFLVDGLVLDFGSATEKMKPLSFAAPAKPRSPRCLVIDGESQEEAVGSVMPLAPALLRILESAAGRPVSARDLAGRLPKLVEPGTRLVRVNVAGDFEFQLPAAAAEPPAEPGEARTRPRDLDPARLEEAIALYRSALEATTREQHPLEWAETLTNLADALQVLGERQGNSDAIEEAVALYRMALEVCTREEAPREWARIRNGLGSALLLLGRQAAETEAPEPAPAKASRPPRGKARRAQAPAAPAEQGDERGDPEEEANTEFVLDDAEAEHDALGRSVLAIGLARRLHKIWRNTNKAGPAGEDQWAAFVVHLDAPWGGGKTTFANFLARVLDPPPGPAPPGSFLAERYSGADVGGIFLDDPPPDAKAAAALASLSPDERRPWVIVNFNAWQAEHCAPPWWVFYQAIRKGCFGAVLREGDGAWRPRPPLAAEAPRHRRFARAVAVAADRAASRLGGLARWLGLWAVEYAWRLFNPKILVLLLTAAISVALLTGLIWSGAWGTTQGSDGTSAGFILTSGAGVILAGLTGVTALWGVGALLTESIVPGTDTLAERLSLGSGDPFARFRRHFAHTMMRVRRPVMVVVDDLDRCRPDFIVDLVRGIQTLLRSPRVTFLILGDRDWIERAFEAHHEAMKAVAVGPEQSLGARFVEKAIQLSFILPALGEESRSAYVRRVLLGDRATAAQQRAAPIAPAAAARVREIVNREAARPGADPFGVERLVELVGKDKAVQADRRARPGLIGLVADQLEYASNQLFDYRHEDYKQLVGETLAIRATTDEKVEREVRHELQALAAGFPANPRQIKRIVNAITIYYAAALQRPKVEPDAKFRARLALWIIVMTEWPETWRLLASFPGLADLLAGKRPPKGMRPPGSARAIAAALARIRSDRELTALITGIPAGGGDPRERLDSASIATLAELTPLYSRKRRLPDPEPPPPAGRKPKPKPKPASAAPAKPARPRRSAR